MKRIYLFGKSGSGKYAIVDNEFYDRLSEHKWYLSEKGYARSDIGLMQRAVFGEYGNKQIDHINHNKLDNRKDNLRTCTSAQNAYNRDLPSTNTSGYKGVCLKRGRWETQVRKKGAKPYTKRHKNILDAANDYDRVAKEWFGEFAYTNFGGIYGNE